MSEKLTPMMQQYSEIRRGLPANTLLLFRLGDFYEMFYEDAEIGARLLGITLTKRQDYPMAGIPFHTADNYVSKLLAAGKKVGICDQSEPAKAGKLVRRQLTRILSSGTKLAANQLDPAKNHYLAALELSKRGLHAAWLDLSTGEFSVATDTHPKNLLPVLIALNPAEIILVEGELERWKVASHEDHACLALQHFCAERSISELPGYHFEIADGAKIVMETLGVLNLEGFGLSNAHPSLGAAGALVYYATENLCAKPENLRSVQEYRSASTLLLDPATLRNLEIFESVQGTRDTALLGAIDRSTTAAGARMLERWLAAPALDIDKIQRRQNVVGELVAQPMGLGELRELLSKVRDIPRILSRLQNRFRNPRELGAVLDMLAQIPAIITVLEQLDARLVGSNRGEVFRLRARLVNLPALRELLGRAIADELPNDLADGGYIRAGYDVELDRLRSLISDNKGWLADLERQEQERTGIRSLKIRFTSVFGYYIEVTKANVHLVPADYVRKQTTVNGERYVTESLKLKENEIFLAEEKSFAREQELFAALVSAVLDESISLSQTADALAELDVLAGWAALAREWDYCRPDLYEGDVLAIADGRHPVVEQMMKQERLGLAGNYTFVPNDTTIAASGQQILLLTGPNMAGKSTYIRQVALITLMAQIGCWVPAKECRIGLVDRIFSRVGASDDLARGNSTFMVEMSETANILNNATEHSLIILDEIGRGTSTYDGLSIAWSVVEYLQRSTERGPRTLFATNYQELTKLDKYLSRLKNYSVAVKEWNDEIIFLRRVVEGATDRSYGIQVARLAGLPLSVIDRAKAILAQLESKKVAVTLPALQAKPKEKISVEKIDESQLSLF